MDRFACDVLVVGGGGAGLRAVIAVAETHPKLRVAVISKVYPMRSHTVSAEGGAAAAIKAGDSMDAHAYATISGADWLPAPAAAAASKDMAFGQYHPTGLPFTGILITEAARAEGGWLLNKDGYRFLQDYDLGKPEPKPVLRSMELGPRDRLSQAFVKEQEKGRTLEGPYGHYVHLDVRHLGEKLIDRKIPFVRELCLKYMNIDPVKEMIPVRPVVHYMMGGISTDIDGATPLAGLYAAGEAACVSINGANRLGSNSLTECLVFGARAGQAAAEGAGQRGEPGPSVLAQADDEGRRLEEKFRRKTGGHERIATLRAEMHETMEESAGIYRTGATLEKAAEKLQSLQERFGDLALADQSYTFNTELTAALELSYMLDVAEAIVQSALRRRESRGSHQRTDFPARDDTEFLAHSLAYRGADGRPRGEYLPVTITRWPPGKRVYGR